MDIKLKEITVRQLTEGFQDNNENGVVGFGGKLDIRPPYQREFIYKDKQRDAVIDTLTKKYPLNVMYWATRDDGNFEIIDGQQRTISICQYVQNQYSVIVGNIPSSRKFNNLFEDEIKQILDYKLMVYICTGKPSEKLEWFETINIAGEKLTEQELRNAVYSGIWVTDAKRYFSKNGCVAYNIGNKYLTGTVNRQDYLETAISWISKGNIEVYMSNHQNDANASAIWRYFQDVISWVVATFVVYRKEMKGINWGLLYDTYKDKVFDTNVLEKEISDLMQDFDVTKKSGIYEYILTRKEKYLNIRAFDEKTKREAFERQKGVCVKCGETFDLYEMEADHITPWHEGGKTNAENCQMLCKNDNRIKSGK